MDVFICLSRCLYWYHHTVVQSLSRVRLSVTPWVYAYVQSHQIAFTKHMLVFWGFVVVVVLVYKLDCCCLVAKSCPTLLRPRGLQPARLLRPQDFPGKNTGVGCHFLLQGNFLTQGMNPYFLLWQGDSLPLSHQGNNFFDSPFVVSVMVVHSLHCYKYSVW